MPRKGKKNDINPNNDDNPPLLPKKIISMGHTAPVTSVALCADASVAISGSDDNTVRVWDLKTGRARVLEGHTSNVLGVALSADGSLAISGSVDDTVRVWDLKTGKARVLKGHINSVSGVALSVDASLAISGSHDHTVRVWDLKTGRARVLEGHTNSVWGVALCADASLAISGSDDNTVRVWDLKTGRARVLEGHTNSVLGVGFSADASLAISGSHDSSVRVWNLKTGKARVLKGHTDSVSSVALSADGSIAISSSDDNTVMVWDLKSGKTRVLEGHSAPVYSVALDADASIAISGSDDNTVRVWDLKSGETYVLKGHTDAVYSVALDADASVAISGSDDNTVRVWDLKSGETRALEGHTDTVYGVALAADASIAISGSYDKTVRVWDLNSGKTRVLEGHTDWVRGVALDADASIAISGSDDNTVRVWELKSDKTRVFEGHIAAVYSVALDADALVAVSGSLDCTVRVWDLKSGETRVLEGHTSSVNSVALDADASIAISGSDDNTVRVWDLKSGKTRVLEGHTDTVYGVALAADASIAISGSADKTVRTWDLKSGKTRVLEGHTDTVNSVALNADASIAVSAAANGVMRVWSLDGIFDRPVSASQETVQYTNAKILLVGDSGVGKTGLSNYLALNIKDEERNTSTDGAWATQWTLSHNEKQSGIDREIWLWDFAGQVDYRLTHQLFMDDTAAAVLVFNPQNENPFDGLGQWDRDLHKATRKPFAKLLVAGRIDRGGVVVSRASIDRFMKERGFAGVLHETSAKTGEGCDALRQAIVKAIDWSKIPETTSIALYHRLKQEILKLRDRGLVLIRFSELQQRVETALHGESLKLEELRAVIDLLSGPGMITRTDFGGFILLRPDLLSRYAAAVVRKVRKHPQDLGCIREEEILSGALDYQDFERLPPEDEAVVLRALQETFVSRAWCLRQVSDGIALLTFPSYFRRERPDQPNHPKSLVTYRFNGPIDDIYATLVVRLHHTEAFETDQLWKFAADFKTQTGTNLGLNLIRETEGSARLEIYFNQDVDENSRVVFLRYVDNHLREHAQDVQRLRHYSCVNKKCGRAFTDRELIDESLMPGGPAKVFCPKCQKPIILRDALERKFESRAVKEQTRLMQEEVKAVIDNESRELLAVHHTGFIVAEAGQIYRGYTNSDHGIDGEVEFKDSEGEATGKRLYLQLKSGDSYLKTRKRDGVEIFQIKKLRWSSYWQRQEYPVMLVIRASDGEIRWMNVSEYLRRERQKGKESIKQIIFDGEPFTAENLRKMRDRLIPPITQ